MRSTVASFPALSKENSQLMNPILERSFVTRFQRLEREQSTLDFDRAVLALAMRDEFLPGEDGDFQFRLWARNKLNLRPSVATRLLNLAHAITLYPNKSDWDIVGGSSSIIFLVGLTTQQRNRVFNASRRRVAQTGRSLNRKAVYRVAEELGVTTPTRGAGVLKAKLTRLQEYVRDLPNLPKDIREIIS